MDFLILNPAINFRTSKTRIPAAPVMFSWQIAICRRNKRLIYQKFVDRSTALHVDVTDNA